jgi:hypothetical protein
MSVKAFRPIVIAIVLGLSGAILALPAFQIQLSDSSVGDAGQVRLALPGEPRLAAAKGNDNETNCDRYDDNDNFEAGSNLVMNLLRKFCLHDREAREVEESAGGQVEGRANTFPGASVQSLVTRGVAPAGRETAIAQQGDRVVVRVFPSLNREVTVTIRNLDPSTLPDTPGTLMPGFVFKIEATAGGSSLTTLTAEARLSAVYTDAELGKLDEQKLALAWLDPSTDGWTDAPKQAADPRNNYLSASITNMGTYAIYQRT